MDYSVYSSFGQSDTRLFCIDSDFYKISCSSLDSIVKDDGINFYWNCKQQPQAKNSIDLRHIYNYYGISSLDDQAVRNHSSNYVNYNNCFERMMADVKAYKQCKINTAKKNIEDLINPKIVKEYLFSKNVILQDFIFSLQNLSCYNEILNFYLRADFLNVISQLNYNIKTQEGIETVNLQYAANYRFKPIHGTLNLFNIVPEKRSKIIPQNENSFIYCIDFKQFEFRTFLKLIESKEYDFDNLNIYQEINNKHNIDKEHIIAYMYGQRNDQLAKIFPKDAILDCITEDLCYVKDGIPVILKENGSDGWKVHTIVQSLSYINFLQKLKRVLLLLEGKKSKFLYPIHDSMCFSIDKSEIKVVKEINEILVDDVYKIKRFIGPNLYELREL